MTLPIATETIISMYLDEHLTEQQIATKLGCSQQVVWARLNRAGISVRRTNKRYLYNELMPHLPVLKSMVSRMRRKRREIAEFVVDPRNDNSERARMAEHLVALNKEITALEIVIRK